MQSKTFIVIIAVVVVALVGAVYVLHSPSSPATTTDNSGFPAYNNQSEVTNTSNGTTSTATPKVTANTYADLFDKFQAHAITFERVSSAAGKYGDVYALYKDEVAFEKKENPKLGTYSIGVTSIDLNTDGNDEVLVYNDLPSFCGTGGCQE
jgi:zona occludens toxin (predicted ATPase)